jgi:uncharacterized protein (DUF58 family)
VTDRTAGPATNRWIGVDAVAWVAVAVGLLAREPGVLLPAAVGVVYTAYARLESLPEPELALARDVSEASPEPGTRVDVRLTVENVGDRLLPDVRIVDGVPSAVGVVEGSPHHGTALRPGESRTVSYAVEAARGTHAFDPVTVVCRSANGAYETERREAVPTTLTCRPAMTGADAPPLRSLVAQHGGELATDSGGSGVEFYGVREYRPGDRANRIDWARRARTGELATLAFREEWRATAVLLVDARTVAYVTAGDDAPTHAVEWGVRAGAELFAGLLDAGTRTGIAALGDSFVWLEPGVGDVHRRRARDLLTTHQTLSPSPPPDRSAPWRSLSPPSSAPSRGTETQLRRLDAHLPVDTQLFFLSPLADDAAVTVARRLQASGGAVTVLSPDVTGGETLGSRVAALDRRRRLRTLRRADVRTVDCQPNEPLAVAFERAGERWR